MRRDILVFLFCKVDRLWFCVLRKFFDLGVVMEMELGVVDIVEEVFNFFRGFKIRNLWNIFGIICYLR